MFRCAPVGVLNPASAVDDSNDLLQFIDVAILERIANHGAIITITMGHRVNEWQSGFSLGQVIANILSQRIGFTRVIQRIVDQLKSQPQVIAKSLS